MTNDLLEYEEEEWGSVASEVAAEFLEEWKFFAPSTDLTRAILQLNDELGGEYFDREYEKLAAVEGDITAFEEPIKDGNWFRWLFQQVSEILFHRGEERAERSVQSEEEAVSFFQAFISERVFNHLAMLSRSHHAKRGKPFSIREELTKGVAEKIGLGLYLHQKTPPDLRAKAEEVLLWLAREFQCWFIEEYGGMFNATWGPIHDFSKDIISEGNDAHSLILITDM